MKRQMAKVTGILQIVFGGIGLLSALFYFMFGCVMIVEGTSHHWYTDHAQVAVGSIFVVIAIITLGSCIAHLALGPKLLRPENLTKDQIQKFAIAALVLSLFGGGTVILILAAITLGSKDGVENQQGQFSQNPYGQGQANPSYYGQGNYPQNPWDSSNPYANQQGNPAQYQNQFGFQQQGGFGQGQGFNPQGQCQQTHGGKADVVVCLEQLKQQRDSGQLTQAEYEQKLAEAVEKL